jgi:hypothetical protein
MDPDTLSAMALDTPLMVKNKIFSMHASRVFSEVKKLNLPTVQEREAEYVKRMKELPNHILYPETEPIKHTVNETEKVRYTFSMPKSASSMPCQYRSAGASAASQA